MTPPRQFVVVSGPPGSGTTTLAAELAGHMRLPLIAKDTIKEALMTACPVADVEASREAGRAAMAIMFALAAEAFGGAVMESSFHRSLASSELQALPGAVAEVFCRCDRQVALARYRSRAHLRHPGHFDEARSDTDLWNDEVTEPVAGGWPVLEVDTDFPVTIPFVLEWLRAQSELTGS
jgi:predicted kinase